MGGRGSISKPKLLCPAQFTPCNMRSAQRILMAASGGYSKKLCSSSRESTGFLICKMPGKHYQDESRIPTGTFTYPLPILPEPNRIGFTPKVLPEGGRSSPRLTPFPGITNSPSLSTPHQALAHSGLQRPCWLSKQSKKHPDKYLPQDQREIFRRGCRQDWDGHSLLLLGSSLFESWSPKLELRDEAQSAKGRKEASPWASLQIPMAMHPDSRATSHRPPPMPCAQLLERHSHWFSPSSSAHSPERSLPQLPSLLLSMGPLSLRGRLLFFLVSWHFLAPDSLRISPSLHISRVSLSPLGPHSSPSFWFSCSLAPSAHVSPSFSFSSTIWPPSLAQPSPAASLELCTALERLQATGKN